MDNLIIFLNDLIKIHEDYHLFDGYQKYLEKKIKEILILISEVYKFEDSSMYFDKLQTIQGLLAKLRYKYHLPITEALNQFIRDFDRVDDKEERKLLFEEIKQGNLITNV